jgi:beta-galactosidase
MHRICGIGLVLICIALPAFVARATAPAGAGDPRTTVPLDSGWRFVQATQVENAESPDYDDSAWARVDVPHTWNRLGNEGTERSPLSNTVRGTGWYRLRFKIPRASPVSRYFLQFDGVAAVAEVWLNGRHLCRHAGAFARFRCDASAVIRSQGENILVVEADNSRPQHGASTENVVPLSGDFFVFGGIYRPVALIITGPTHVDMLDFGGPGLYARALKVDQTAAVVAVTAKLASEAPTPQHVIVETTIEDASGKAVASDPGHSFLVSATGAISHGTLRVPRPRLWQGTADPYLYQVIVTLRSPDGSVLDRIRQPLGLRTMRFDPNEGFFLNGEHLFLKGVSMHQDRPIKGWATSRPDQDEDFGTLIDLGANAVRLAHYQHGQYAYDLADALGIVAWAEIPLVNQVSFDGSPANPALIANARQQLIELIRQNYNHPSIAVWSIANEIDLVATQTKGQSTALALLKSLNLLAKNEDPGRTTTFADCCEEAMRSHVGVGVGGGAQREVIVGAADTIGYNRYFGWYYGDIPDFGPMLDEAHARHPQLPLAVSEYGAGGALTQHTDEPSGGPISRHGRPHPEEFQSAYHERSWDILRSRRYLWGVFVWNLFDFSSDSRREGDLTDINDKGLVSYDRHVRKDAFYFYRANWSSQPTLHLTGRRHADRPYWVIDVKAYSNATRARLWINDVDQGDAACAVGTCVWSSVHLRIGANELRAEAEIAGKSMSDTLQWTLARSPGSINIKAGDLSGYVSTDGQRYGSDMYFRGGKGQEINAPETPGPLQVRVVAADARAYDTFREGDFSYRVPVPPGTYHVVVKFAEPVANTAGARLFDVDVNGETMLKDFDVFAAAGGKRRGVDREFEATAQNGCILLDFRSLKREALVSALSITPVASQ